MNKKEAIAFEENYRATLKRLEHDAKADASWNTFVARAKAAGTLVLGFLWVSFLVLAFLAIVFDIVTLGGDRDMPSGDPGDVNWCEFENWC